MKERTFVNHPIKKHVRSAMQRLSLSSWTRGLLASMFLVFAFGTTASAQQDLGKKDNLPSKVNKLLDKAKKGVRQTGKKVGNFLGFESRTDSDLVEIDGVEYMLLYPKSIFKGNASDIINLCKKDVKKRYPKSTFMKAVIPQTDWLETATQKGSKIVGYKRTLSCYVLAADGNDGYIHVHYLFEASRKPGGEWVNDAEKWPEMMRADIIPNVHYEKLKNLK